MLQPMNKIHALCDGECLRKPDASSFFHEQPAEDDNLLGPLKMLARKTGW